MVNMQLVTFFQSYHTGIETCFKITIISKRRSSNRTILELKLDNLISKVNGILASNRTILELKPGISVLRSHLSSASNRTILELKQVGCRDRILTTRLPIVPYWN